MTNLILVSLPSSAIAETAPIWLPFVEQIARRQGASLQQLVDQVMTDEVQLHLAWDPDARVAHALAGTRIILCGAKRRGELIWTTGLGRARWLPLLADLETYHRDRFGCAGMTAVCRPGWRRDLRTQGYRVTHLVMEKDF